MRELAHDRVDLIKLGVEGAERVEPRSTRADGYKLVAADNWNLRHVREPLVRAAGGLA